jgi:hypothetical protein
MPVALPTQLAGPKAAVVATDMPMVQPATPAPAQSDSARSARPKPERAKLDLPKLEPMAANVVAFARVKAPAKGPALSNGAAKPAVKAKPKARSKVAAAAVAVPPAKVEAVAPKKRRPAQAKKPAPKRAKPSRPSARR